MTSPGPPAKQALGGSGRLRDPRFAGFVPWDSIGASRASSGLSRLLWMLRTRSPGTPGAFFVSLYHRSPRRSADMARADPLRREGLPTSAATPSALYLPPEQHAALQPRVL